MRILLTTDTVGGVWTFTKELTEHYLRNGHHVALLSLGRYPSHEQQAWCVQALVAYRDRFIYNCSDAPLEWMQNNANAYEQGLVPLLKLSKSFRPEIVHSNQFCFGRLPIEVPTIITAHSDVLSWASACKPEGLEASPWLDYYIDIVQQGLEAADLVTAPTAWMRNELCRHFHVPCRIEVIPNGRDLEFTLEDKTDLRAVSVGRLWDEAKGLRKLAKIKSTVPVVIAGEEQFENTAVSVGGDELKFLGRLNEEQLVALFRQSSVYIVTSVYEPFGLAPLEAALCGCAILASDIPSLREVWSDAAMYFTDQASLELSLSSLTKDKRKLKRMQRAALNRARQFSGARMAAQYVGSYTTLLNESCGEPSITAEDKFVCNAA